MQKEYYSSREDHDYELFKKNSKKRLIALLIVLAAAIVTDVIILLVCPQTIATIISVGGEYLMIDKLIFFIVTLVAELAFAYIGYTNEEKRMSYVVWDAFILILMLISLFRSI